MLHRIPSAGVELSVLDQGRGPPVVLGHGMLCDHRVFMAQIEALSARHRVIALDFRGHGRSQVPTSWAMSDVAADFIHVLDALAIDRAVLVGFSMGGMAAMHVALAEPRRVSGLVLIDTSADVETPWIRLKFHALARAIAGLGPRPWILREASKAMFGPDFRRAHADVVHDWESGIASMRRRAVFGVARMVADRGAVIDRLSEIAVPVQVIVGDRDVNTPPRCSERIAARLPHGQLEVLRDAGHGTPLERPGEVTRLIAGLMERVSD